jgi:hypothetical protein
MVVEIKINTNTAAMRKDLTDNFSIFLSIIKALKSNPVLNSIPAIKELIVEMEAIEKQVVEQLAQMEAHNKDCSHKIAYNDARNKVQSRIHNLTKTLEIIFKEKHDAVSANRFHHTSTDIMIAGGNTLTSIYKQIKEVTASCLTELTKYNITNVELEELDAHMALLNKAQSDIKTYDDTRSKQLQDIQNLVNGKIRKLMKQADNLVETIRLTQPEAYRFYRDNRKEHSSNETPILIRVVHEGTLEPAENTKVIITSTTRFENGKPLVLLERTTGPGGTLRIGKFDYDVVDLTFIKIGCHEEYRKKVIADNTPIKMDIVLRKKEID